MLRFDPDYSLSRPRDRALLDAAIDAYAEARATEEVIRDMSGKYSQSAAICSRRRREAVTEILDSMTRTVERDEEVAA